MLARTAKNRSKISVVERYTASTIHDNEEAESDKIAFDEPVWKIIYAGDGLTGG